MANVLDRINRTTRRQRGGYALMGGGLVALVVGLIEPGGVLVNSTDRLDFAGRVDVMANNAALTHFTSIFAAMALVTIIAGLMVVWNTAHEEGLDCTATRYGLMMAGLGTGALVLGEGIDQMMVIAVNDGLGGVFAARSAEVMQVAVSMHSIKAGIAIVALPLVMLGASSVSIGLRPILPAGLQRAAALVVSVVGVVWAVLFWVIASIFDFEGWNAINGIGAVIALIWLMMLGRTMQSGTIGRHNNTSVNA
ncbi:hypothetical protein [Candidatus Poriferisodalis sp.]|uniref:hypothetical protein n=1 Tax=Candidatus Poriferisodalis sp. TaxID=3101277 RepID=UPI003B020038